MSAKFIAFMVASFVFIFGVTMGATAAFAASGGCAEICRNPARIHVQKLPSTCRRLAANTPKQLASIRSKTAQNSAIPTQT